jgi:hypothetical protein
MKVLQQCPPDNAETYHWRGDMGLLDRLSYENLETIPRNWNMTTMDTAAIKSRTEYLLSNSENSEMRLITNEPQAARTLATEMIHPVPRIILPAELGGTSTDLVAIPPKKKRYNSPDNH